jgi:hypothetical protein
MGMLSRPVVVEALTVFILATSVYVGAYFSLVCPTRPVVCSGVGPWRCEARYRFFSNPAEIFWRPMEWVDRRIRPRAWCANSNTVWDGEPDEEFSEQVP